MTQEDKELLLKDLAARVPYQIKCAILHNENVWKDNETIFYVAGANIITYEGYERNECYMYWQIKPYLRPMSSMTEEEKKEHDNLRAHICDDYNRYCFDTYKSIDWLIANHFDYRGLIEKGLALEAPEGMYN